MAIDAVCMWRPSQFLPMTLHKGQSSKLNSTSFCLEDASTLLWIRASVSQNYFFVVVLLSIKLAELQHSINLSILCKNLLGKRIQVVLSSSFCFMQLLKMKTLSAAFLKFDGLEWLALPLFLYSLCPVYFILLLLFFKLANLEKWDTANGKKSHSYHLHSDNSE